MFWGFIDKLRGIEGRAKTSTGTVFLLKHNEMVGTDIFTYTATRKQACLGLLSGGFWYTETGYKGSTLTSITVTNFSNGDLKIGCQYFYKTEADKLKAWAAKGQ